MTLPHKASVAQGCADLVSSSDAWADVTPVFEEIAFTTIIYKFNIGKGYKRRMLDQSKANTMLVELNADSSESIRIQPRWPYRRVFVSSVAYQQLKEVQFCLYGSDISIILTRGLEREGLLLRLLHKMARRLGAVAFCAVFPSRRSEVHDIFGSNGHDVSANCVDVGIAVGGQQIDLLPHGVFTSTTRREHIYRVHREAIDKVHAALRVGGFCVHLNRTEALQIHCELGDTLGEWRHHP
jgi:hypothetical protein